MSIFFKDFKVNNYLVSRILDNSLKVCILYLPACCNNRKSCCFLFLLRLTITFEPFWSDFKTMLRGSSFCTFGRVMYKTKTLVKFVDKRKSCCFSFLLRSTITFEPVWGDFETILRGSSFCTFGRVMHKTKTLVIFIENRKSCCFLLLRRSIITFEPF